MRFEFHYTTVFIVLSEQNRTKDRTLYGTVFVINTVLSIFSGDLSTDQIKIDYYMK